MKISIVSPSFPPKNCGVGDYSARLATELARRGHAVTVWTSQQDAREVAVAGVTVRKVISAWDPKALLKLRKEIVAAKPAAVILQFTPNLFAPGLYGVHPLLAPWIAALRIELRRPVILTAHELHYPMGLSLDRLVIGVSQFAQILSLVSAASGVICTYEAAVKHLERYLPWFKHRISWAPSGATVLPYEGELPEIGQDLPAESAVLLHFGSAHPSKLMDHALEALAERQRHAPGKTVLAFAGLAQAECDDLLRKNGAHSLAPHVRALGYLTDAEVTAWMDRADVVLAPFIDGISTRRTSVIGALAHGRAVASTLGWASESKEIPWKDFVALSPAGDREAFARMVGRLLEDPMERKRLATAGLREYRNRFAWDVIADSVIDRIAG